MERGLARRMLISGVAAHRAAAGACRRLSCRSEPAFRLLHRARPRVGRHPLQRRGGRALAGSGGASARSGWSPTTSTCAAPATRSASGSAPTSRIVSRRGRRPIPTSRQIFIEYNKYLLGRAAGLLGHLMSHGAPALAPLRSGLLRRHRARGAALLPDQPVRHAGAARLGPCLGALPPLVRALPARHPHPGRRRRRRAAPAWSPVKHQSMFETMEIVLMLDSRRWC